MKCLDVIPTITDDEHSQLQQKIIKHGVNDPLTIWETTTTIAQIDDTGQPVFILIDGHNRYNICLQYKIDYRINLVRFDTLDEAKDYMIDYQLGRRNLTVEQASYLRGKRYLQQKSMRGGSRLSNSVQVDVAAKLGEKYSVSSRTIKRDADFATGLDKLAPELKQQVLSGRKTLPKSFVTTIAKANIEQPIDSILDILHRVSNDETSVQLTEGDSLLTSGNKRINQLQAQIRELTTKTLNQASCKKLIVKTTELLQLFQAK